MALIPWRLPRRLSSPVLATAAEATSPIKYKAAIGYDFEKVSHPTVGTSQPDGIVGYLGNGAVSCRV